MNIFTLLYIYEYIFFELGQKMYVTYYRICKYYTSTLCFFSGRREYVLIIRSPISLPHTLESLSFRFCSLLLSSPFCIRNRGNGSRVVSIAANFAGPTFYAGVANFQMGTRASFERTGAQLLRKRRWRSYFSIDKRLEIPVALWRCASLFIVHRVVHKIRSIRAL